MLSERLDPPGSQSKMAKEGINTGKKVCFTIVFPACEPSADLLFVGVTIIIVD